MRQGNALHAAHCRPPEGQVQLLAEQKPGGLNDADAWGRKPHIMCPGIAVVAAMVIMAIPAQAVSRLNLSRQDTSSVVTQPGRERLRLSRSFLHVILALSCNPAVVPRNMLGRAGWSPPTGRLLSAPQDGTTLFMIAQPHAQSGDGVSTPVRRAFHRVGVTIDTPNVINACNTSDVRTIQDAMQRALVLAAPPAPTRSCIPPVSTRWPAPLQGGRRLPHGGELNSAMERGETQGRVVRIRMS